MVKADVKDVSFINIRQATKGGAVNLFVGSSDNLSIFENLITRRAR
jgi:hypothetical protein